MPSANIVNALETALGQGVVIHGSDIDERYIEDVLGNRGEAPLAVVRPLSTHDVSRALAICHEFGAPIVTQGGRTGLALGQLPRKDEIVLSLERMTKIEVVDADAGTATVQAGVILQALQDEVEKEGLTFPLDLGGRGSCTIGGNIATNAGGNRVIRYGMTRDLVVGIEAVLADGTVLDSLRTVTKNNTGPDLKQLFIGSEGMLGVVTRAVLRLVPKPAERIVALCAVDDFSRVRALLRHCRARLGGDLTAFEVMWRSYYSRAVGLAGSPPPIATDHAYHILIEASGMDSRLLRDTLELALGEASDRGVIADAVVSRSGADNDRLWRVRDLAIETSRLLAPFVPFDVSVGIRDMEAFVKDVGNAARDIDRRCEMLVFGHIGDGNLHFAIHNPSDREELFEQIEHVVYQCVGAYRGSVSAEHGIGWLKRDFLKYTRSPAEIQTMRMLKMTLDPKRILNRNRVLAI